MLPSSGAGGLKVARLSRLLALEVRWEASARAVECGLQPALTKEHACACGLFISTLK